ncbi:hypothetical protein ACWCXH_37915 [Kitasatospora sp. NPDC001660]
MIGSEEYVDCSEQLLPWQAVEAKLPEYLAEAGPRAPGDNSPFDGSALVTRLRRRLGEAAAKVVTCAAGAPATTAGAAPRPRRP